MNQKKQQNPVFCLVLGIILLIFAVVFLIGEIGFLTSGYEDLNQAALAGTFEELEGKAVAIDVDAVLETFAETSHQWNGITIGKDRHYLLWLDDNSILAASANGKPAKALDALIDLTWEFIDGNAAELTKDKVALKGKLNPLEGDLLKYYKECLEEMGAADAGMEIRYYQIDCSNPKTLTMLEILLLAVLSSVMFAVYFAGRANRKKELAAEQTAVIEAYGPDAAENTSASDTGESGYEDPFAGMRGDEDDPFGLNDRRP